VVSSAATSTSAEAASLLAAASAPLHLAQQRTCTEHAAGMQC
jgi:hypothetical protein